MKSAKIYILGLSALFISVSVSAQSKSKKMTTEIEKFSYSLGMDIANNINNAKFDSLVIERLLQGLGDVLNKKETAFSADEASGIIKNYLTKLQSAAGAKKLEEGANFLAENAKKPGVITLPSGLQYEIIQAGSGDKPSYNDQVTTHYTGTLIDGTVFDSSVKRGEPATFPVSGVIAGWTEALQLMPVGSKWRLYIPANLAYGERGAGGAIGPNETLIFDIELISINK